MENLIIRQAQAFDRVTEFGSNHPLTPAIARATTLYTQVETVAGILRDHAADQQSGRGEFRSGVSTRRQLADELLELMRPLNAMARALDRVQFPGVREQFKMPRRGGYEGIISGAQAFINAAGPIKSVFVDRGMAADFDAVLSAKKAELVTATNRKYTGLADQVGGTAGLIDVAREGMRLVRELDSILSHQYRSNAALFAAWKSACRVERNPQRESEAEGATTVAGGAAA